MKSNLPSCLAAVLAAALAAALVGTATLPAQTLDRGRYTDPTLGFKVKVPKKWRQIPTKPEEQWIVALFQSDKEFHNRDGYSRKLMMRVIMFDKNAGKKKKKKKKEEGVIRIGRSSRYRDYTDFVKQTQGGGGFYFSVETERKGGGTPAMIYEVKFEKMAYAKRRLIAWEFKRQDISFAVEFDVFEEHYKKLKSMMMSTMRSFKFIPIEDGESAGGISGTIKIPKLEEWKKLPLLERQKKRLELEEAQQKKLLAKLPKDWKVITTKHFLVISHASPKFNKTVLSAADACWAWLEKRFGKVSDEYVRRCIIRICKDYDEYAAYHGGSGGGFFISFGSFGAEVDELQFFEGEIMREQMSYLMRNLFRHYIRDKDSELMDGAPGWLQAGLGGYLSGTVLKGRKISFAPTVNHRVAIAKLIQKGGFRNGSLKTVKELMNMTDKERRELDKKEGSPRYQMAQLVYFLEGTGKKHKVFGGKDFLLEYCRTGQAVEDEYDEKNPSEWRSRKEATTEEEEEEQAEKAGQGSKEWREASDKRARAVLDLLNTKACDWSDAEWKSLQKAYARTCKK